MLYLPHEVDGMGRIILHVDMNAFFATCEQLANPHLKGKPIVVGGHTSRSVVSTASYEARAYGIRSAMPIFQAKKLCPNVIIIEHHFDLYVSYSERFMAILTEYTDLIEMASIDECYMDVSNWLGSHPDPLGAIGQLQNRIRQETGLMCSIGVAPNKFLAKLASDFKKPNGITVIHKKDMEKLVWPLPIDAMFGIGKKTAARLREIGVLTIRDVAQGENNGLLKQALGKMFKQFYAWAHGEDDEPVNAHQEAAKSIGNSTTLPHNTSDYDELKTVLNQLTHQVIDRALEAEIVGKTVTLTLKFADFTVQTRSSKMVEVTNQFDIIWLKVLALFDRHYHGQKPLRLLGVALHDVIPKNQMARQLSLFDGKKVSTSPELLKLVQSINQKMGRECVQITSQWAKPLGKKGDLYER